MGAEPKRWTVEEMCAACVRGNRDFRGADLSGLDLRGVGWPDRDQAWAYVVSGLTRALLNRTRGQP